MSVMHSYKKHASPVVISHSSAEANTVGISFRVVEGEKKKVKKIRVVAQSAPKTKIRMLWKFGIFLCIFFNTDIILCMIPYIVCLA